MRLSSVSFVFLYTLPRFKMAPAGQLLEFKPGFLVLRSPGAETPSHLAV